MYNLHDTSNIAVLSIFDYHIGKIKDPRVDELVHAFSHDLPMEDVLALNLLVGSEFPGVAEEQSHYFIKGINPLILNKKGVEFFSDIMNRATGGDVMMEQYRKMAFLIKPSYDLLKNLSTNPSAAQIKEKIERFTTKFEENYKSKGLELLLKI